MTSSLMSLHSSDQGTNSVDTSMERSPSITVDHCESPDILLPITTIKTAQPTAMTATNTNTKRIAPKPEVVDTVAGSIEIGDKSSKRITEMSPTAVDIPAMLSNLLQSQSGQEDQGEISIAGSLSTEAPAVGAKIETIHMPSTEENSHSHQTTDLIDVSNFQLSSLPPFSHYEFTQTQRALTQAALSSLSLTGEQHSMGEPELQPAHQRPLPVEYGNKQLDTGADFLSKELLESYTMEEIMEKLQEKPYLTTEMLKRELMNQKVRADNRERKKRWREQNEERNKDNDLRCRVNKRAHKLFGKEDSEAKRRWVEDEFMKRQYRRKEKERRRNVVDNVVGSSSSSSPTNISSPIPTVNDPLSGIPLADRHHGNDSNNNTHSTASHLPLLQDAYLSMLMNNLESLPPAAALKLVEGIRLMEATIKSEGADHALPQQLADFLRQLQQLQTSTDVVSEVTSVDSSPIAETLSTTASPRQLPSPSSSSVATVTVLPDMMRSTTPNISVSMTPKATATTITTTSIADQPLLPSALLKRKSDHTEAGDLDGRRFKLARESASVASILPDGNERGVSTAEHSNRALDRTHTLKPSVSLSAPSSSSSPSPSSPSLSSPSPSPFSQDAASNHDGLSALLIQTLQQAAVASEDKQEYFVTAPSSPAATEDGSEASQHPSQLYPFEAVMTLMKLNTEWTKQ